jgi:hypothetical protein
MGDMRFWQRYAEGLNSFDMFCLFDGLEGSSDFTMSVSYPSTGCNIPESLNLQTPLKIIFWKQEHQGN